MRTSQFSLLQKPDVVVLAAGHGANDPGAVNLPYNERDQVIFITDKVAAILRGKGIEVVIVPHALELGDSIRWINSKYDFGEAWVIEIHRDSYNGLDPTDASTRLGVYYGNSENSKAIGDFIQKIFKNKSGNSRAWSKSHTASGHRRLGWIADTKPVAHLFEMAFMQGRNDEEHLNWLANVAAAAIFEAFTGNSF
jgi:N-acetylmuramoyl-L-alanine amidase